MSRIEYKVRLLRVAEDDFTEIVIYIAADRPTAAEAVAAKIEKNLKLLSHNPYVGRVPKEDQLAQLGYRYLVVQDYLVFYTIEERAIYVHRILHGARDYLSLF